jgi:hypothetical protein
MSGDRAADLKAAPPWRADPRRHADAGGLARQEATPDDARPACPPPLADRAHERLAESDARIATRRDRKADNYLAFLQLGMIVVLTRSF